MADTLRRKAEELFQQAADLPRERRAAFLDRCCANELDVRAEVESLLVHLDDDTIKPLRTEDTKLSHALDMESERIGPYRLLQLIGEGGFGSVYMAEQLQPVRRKVALKIIKLGMDTRQVIARFEAERQALALMEHPNIAKVLDAGATDTGRPYFVMELVRGIPITDYCDRNNLSTRERLELFVQICRAVQHAHQKGVIHRDIKPSNVLVTLHDGTPVPKIIDFGIAKATSQRLTEKTLFTEFMQFIGTPQYMSPEQAEMSGLDVDTRTDIYSLGVLLYELITGTTPFDGDTLRDAAYTEVQRIIREVDPPTPSKRLSTLGDRLHEVARSRRSEGKALSRLVRGDLDWIVMKALDKDRTRRYETAAALAADVQHHLDNEPVKAGPPGAGYKVYKFVRRHRVGVVAGAVVAGAVLIGFAAATVGFIEARHERDHAVAAEQAAKKEAASAKAINAFFNDMLTSADPMQVRLLSAFAPHEGVTTLAVGGFARDVSLAEMARRAAREVDNAFAGKPELEASSRETIGMMLRGLGLFADAEPELREALSIRRRTLGPRHPDTLRSALALGDLALESGRGADAEPLVLEAHKGMVRVYGEEDPRTLSCAAILASVYSDQGKYKESERLFAATLEAQRRTLGPEHRDTLTTMWKWSTSYLSMGQLAEGQALARELHDIASRTLSPDDSLNVLSKPLMGWWYLEQYRYDLAEAVFRPGLEQCRRILGPQHPVTYMTMHGLACSLQGAEAQPQKEKLHREALAGLRATRGRLHRHTITTTADFARWLARSGRFGEAEQLFQALAADWARSLGQDDNNTLRAMNELAKFLTQIGKIDQAVVVHRERMATLKRLADEDLGMAARLQDAFDEYAKGLVRMGRLEEAREVTAALLEVLRKNVERAPEEPLYLNNYAWALLICAPADMRDVEAALPLAEKAVQLSGEPSPPILDTLALACHLSGLNDKAIEIEKQSVSLLPKEMSGDLLYSASLVRYLLAGGDTAGAEAVVQEGVNKYRTLYGADNPALADILMKNGDWLVEAGHYSMAEGLFAEAANVNRRLLGDHHEQLAISLTHLARVYCLQSKYELAEPTYREALAIFREQLGDDNVSVAETMYALGKVLHHAGDAAAAIPMIRAALDVYAKLDADEIPAAILARRHLAQILIDTGNLDEAEPLARDALAKARNIFGDEHLTTALAMQTVGELLVRQGRPEQAEPLLRESADVHQRLNLPERECWLAAEANGAVGACLAAQQRYAEAEPLLLDSYAVIHTAKGDHYVGTRTALRRLITLYQAWGRADACAEWEAKAAAATPSRPE